MMDAAIFSALKAGAKLAHIVRVSLPSYTIRWVLEGGFVQWGGETFLTRDKSYGVLDSISDIVDGVGDDSSPVELVVDPPSLATLAGLGAIDVQGARVEIYMVALVNGALAGTPYRIHIGYLDAPRYQVALRRISYSILTAEALALEPNDEQRQSDAFHRDIWPGERGYEYQTDGPKKVFWRDDDPNNFIGFRSFRKKKGGDPIEFTYQTDEAWSFPFGRVALPGTLNYRVGYGPTNRYQSLFCTLGASGPISAYVKFICDEEEISFDSYGKATSGIHKDNMWVERKLGTQPQTALASPTGPGAGSPADGWTTDHKQSGKACFVWTGFENSKKDQFRGGIPEWIHVLEGLKGYVPLLDSTVAGGAGSSRIGLPSTWSYLTDPLDVALNWAIGRWEGDSGGGLYGVPYLSKIVGGYGAPLEAIDVQAHLAASQVTRGYGWKVSDVPTSAEDKFNVRKRLLQAGGCEPATICGMVSLVCNAAPLTSLVTATNKDTAGDLSIDLQTSRLERRNVSQPKFKSEDHQWEMVQLRTIGKSSWAVEDGGRRMRGPSYPAVPNKDQCAALEYLALAHDRALQGEAPMLPWMMYVEPGKAFTWNEPEFLLTGVKVQVRRRSYNPMKGVVKVRFRAERDADYSEALAQVGVTPPASTSNAPPAAFINAPAIYTPTVSSGTVTLTVRAPSDLSFDYIEVRRSVNSTTMPGTNLVPPIMGAPSQTFTVTDTPGSGVIRYWARAVSDTGAQSAWVQTGVTV